MLHGVNSNYNTTWKTTEKHQCHLRNKICVTKQPNLGEYTNKHTALKKRSIIIYIIELFGYCKLSKCSKTNYYKTSLMCTNLQLNIHM